MLGLVRDGWLRLSVGVYSSDDILMLYGSLYFKIGYIFTLAVVYQFVY